MKYEIDSHKLMYHPDVLAKFLTGEKIVPTNMEISPSGACNLRCKFCSQSFLEYEPNFLDEKVLLDNIKGIADKGLKAVVFAGEGEPLLNNKTPDMINEIKKMGVDIGMSTNALLMNQQISEECLSSLEWVRVSLNAGTSHTYNNIHGKADDFQGIERVFENLSQMIEVKKKHNLKTTIGVQMVLIPDNKDDVVVLAKRLKAIGVDYFTVKPFSWHSKMDVSFHDYIIECSIDKQREQLMQLQTEDFSIILRENSFDCLKNGKSYSKCYGIPFWSYISSKGDVWPCLAYIESKGFKYGNIYEESLKDIIFGENKARIDKLMSNMDISNCRKGCRLEAINKFLTRLIEDPLEHVNFI